ncbi:hypothetical protein FGB62_35g10 [Gracilaria domingensis]|nr:hypothetical protein FGB62_35g10 [Gracilaria domingensis]
METSRRLARHRKQVAAPAGVAHYGDAAPAGAAHKSSLRVSGSGASWKGRAGWPGTASKSPCRRARSIMETSRRLAPRIMGTPRRAGVAQKRVGVTAAAAQSGDDAPRHAGLLHRNKRRVLLLVMLGMSGTRLFARQKRGHEERKL